MANAAQTAPINIVYLNNFMGFVVLLIVLLSTLEPFPELVDNSSKSLAGQRDSTLDAKLKSNPCKYANVNDLKFFTSYLLKLSYLSDS